MIKKVSQVLMISFTILALAGCATAANPTTITSMPTSVPPNETQVPTVTPLPPSETPTPLPPIATATQVTNPIVHYLSGQAFTVTDIHMLDANSGWAIGSLGAQVGDHVLFSTDGGNTWKDVTPPEELAASDEHKSAVGFFQDANTAWVTYAIGGGTPVPTTPVVWYTTDAGATWNASQPLDTSGLSEIYVPSNMQFVGDSGWILVHVGVGMNHDYVALFQSSDGGASWKRLLDPYNDGGIQSCSKNAMLFTDATHGWLTGDCNGVKAGVLLFNTTDAGATWQAVTLPEPAGAAGIFAVESNLACGAYDPFFFSNDSGHLSVRCVNYTGATFTYSYYIYTTQDGGSTWTASSYPGNALYFINADMGWAISNKVQLTTDGGKTWKPISDVTWTAQFDFVNANTGWVIATADNEVALVKSDNGGARWSILTPTVH